MSAVPIHQTSPSIASTVPITGSGRATTSEAVAALPAIAEVIFCCFSAGDLALYEALFGQTPA